MIFMSESLFVLPESFDDALLDEIEPFLADPEVLYVAGDMSNDIWLDEDEAVSILANYGQVRKYLHNKVLGRGFNRPQRPQQQCRGAPPTAACGEWTITTSWQHCATKEVVKEVPHQSQHLRQVRQERALGSRVHQPT